MTRYREIAPPCRLLMNRRDGRVWFKLRTSILLLTTIPEYMLITSLWFYANFEADMDNAASNKSLLHPSPSHRIYIRRDRVGSSAERTTKNVLKSAAVAIRLP